MKKLFLIPALFFSFFQISFSQIVINEVMYAPASPNKEWFEVYNTSGSSVSLQNWKWKDAAASNPARIITSSPVDIPPNSYALVCEDTANVRLFYPGINGILLQSSGWNALNNSGNENIVLYNSASVTIDSLTYNNSWGGTPAGNSLEKKISAGNTNDPANWGTSTDILHATPLRQNSLTPKSYDLALKSFVFNPLFPVEGESIEMKFVLKNSGINIASDFSLKIFKDLDLDSIPENNELIHLNNFTALQSNDSISYSFSLQNNDTGMHQYIAKIFYAADVDTSNNTLIKRITVSPYGSQSGGIVINEIMYDPFTNQSEWIEIYNASGQTVNLKGWKYKESSSTVTLSTADLFFNPGDYFILAHDSSLYSSFGYLKNLRANQHIKFTTGMSLNNTGETITVTDSLNSVVDLVTYNPNWNNPNIPDTKGISLERINPSFNSNDNKNWSSCTIPAGGTPAEINSIYTKNVNSNSAITISPNPFSPDGDGFEDFTLIKYKLNVSFAQMRVKVFDIKGRIVKTLANNSVSGKEGTIIFNGFDDSNQRLRIGIYILLIEAIDDRGGTIEYIKSPIVVAAKL